MMKTDVGIGTDNIAYVCPKCATAIVVHVADKDISLLKTSMRCPSECGGRQTKSIKQHLKVGFFAKYDVKPMSALSFYQASLGCGSPEEKKCGPTAIRKEIIGEKIVSIHLQKSPDPNRSLIFSMSLGNGKTIHFATSTKGATIYRMTSNKSRHAS